MRMVTRENRIIKGVLWIEENKKTLYQKINIVIRDHYISITISTVIE